MEKIFGKDNNKTTEMKKLRNEGKTLQKLIGGQSSTLKQYLKCGQFLEMNMTK